MKNIVKSIKDKIMWGRLLSDAKVGADLSPGDPVAAWATQKIRELASES